MDIKIQKGGFKEKGLYFIFYSSSNHNFKRIFKNDEWKIYHNRTNMSLDEILTLFFRGFYVKNNENKIYKNVLNDTIIGNIRKSLPNYSNDYIINKVLEDKESDLILFFKKTIEELELILDNNSIEAALKENLIKLKEKIESLKNKKDKIFFFKKIIYIYNKKISDDNKKIEILLSDKNNFINKSIFDYDEIKKFNINTNNKLITINRIIYQESKVLNIINFLREKYKMNIDSYFTVDVNILYNKINYYKKFNNDELFILCNISNSIILKEHNNISNSIILKEHSANLQIKRYSRILFFILTLGGIITSAIFSGGTLIPIIVTAPLLGGPLLVTKFKSPSNTCITYKTYVNTKNNNLFDTIIPGSIISNKQKNILDNKYKIFEIKKFHNFEKNKNIYKDEIFYIFEKIIINKKEELFFINEAKIVYDFEKNSTFKFSFLKKENKKTFFYKPINDINKRIKINSLKKYVFYIKNKDLNLLI